MVVPVPTPAHTVEVIANGIVGLHHIRLGVSPDVLVPHIDAVQTGLDGNGVAHTLVCRQEVGLRSQRTEFGISLHRVVAHLIVAPQIVNQTAGDVVSDTFWGVFAQWFSLIEFYDFSLGLNIFSLFHIQFFLQVNKLTSEQVNELSVFLGENYLWTLLHIPVYSSTC